MMLIILFFMPLKFDRSKESEVIYMVSDHIEMVDSPAYESANRIYDTVKMRNGNSIDNII